MPQSEAPLQLTQVPAKPTCTQIFNTGTCADSWRNYKQALAQRQQEELQLYVNRQKELASSQATRMSETLYPAAEKTSSA